MGVAGGVLRPQPGGTQLGGYSDLSGGCTQSGGTELRGLPSPTAGGYSNLSLGVLSQGGYSAGEGYSARGTQSHSWGVLRPQLGGVLCWGGGTQLAMWQLVCLLRSRRRSFLLEMTFNTLAVVNFIFFVS